MKIFTAGPEAKISSDIKLYRGYEYEYVLESYFYVKNNIENKYNDVLRYNKESRQESFENQGV